MRKFIYIYETNKTTMNENFKAIADVLAKAGLKSSAEDQTGKPVDFKITPYSLNTKLSFRFQSLDEFLEFLASFGFESTPEKTAMVQSAFMELGLDPKEFFYVNFFEKGKEVEM
ncbi:MAG: hypothetical protein EOO48_04550 [Flavobacterium sp.]|nr:MAG: hypothetical protein EOO48_04550 [Flavobacterium sp.]